MAPFVKGGDRVQPPKHPAAEKQWIPGPAYDMIKRTGRYETASEKPGIYDGTGGAPYTGDVLIEDDRIGKLFINGKLVLDGSELNEDALKTTGRAIPVLGTQGRQRKMKKYRNTGKMIGIFALALALLVSLTACGSPAQTKPASQPAPESSASTDRTEASAEPETQAEDTESSDRRILVLYFSRIGEQYGVGVIDHGNTAIVAEMIGEATGADLYEILPADDHYPMTYKELTDVALQEQREGARPAFAGELPDCENYDTIFIGAPVWWGDWPMILYTVFESTPLSGKTLIPFSTHAGSGLSGFDRSLAAVYPDCTIAEGLAVAGTDAQNHPDKVKNSVTDWLSGLGF